MEALGCGVGREGSDMFGKSVFVSADLVLQAVWGAVETSSAISKL